ncbi:DUF4233 domain-containing protein [Frigoribacterium sp. CFBP9039]|uniref:DUF4233 domain-containing protein n=1 Tax=Frigoribacterium TaxID=96492 RepID=UPI001FAD7F49|nr:MULTISPECIES: DUF4233 domain-containing protein [Frigoribacterium]MCJ0701522.1 DUF4233 domain-containing protein [Frigoribacterium faeni]MDY0947250.1 DUF4233 domain-containing protein [Frigoribacterium sp. CFBP9039]
MTTVPPPDGGAPAPGRARRRRGAAESLLSIVLVLEAMSMFFVMLVVNGRDLLPTGVAFGGGLAAIVVMLLVSRVLRHRWGIVLGWIVQAGLIACGLLDPVMYVVAGVFVALWTYCLVKGTQLDRLNAARYGDPAGTA